MADVIAVRSAYRLEQWAQIIAECQASGESNRKFCKMRGVSEKTYYYWLRKLRVMAIEKAAPELIKLEGSRHAEAEAVVESGIKIRYHDAELTLAAGTDSKTIEAVLKAIKGLC